MGLLCVLTERVLLGTADKLVSRDHSSRCHVGGPSTLTSTTLFFFICDGLTTVLDVRIWLGSAEKLWTPRFFFLTACWWPFLLSQFGSARLLEWLLVFFGMWFYQVSGLTVMLATLLMLFVSRRPAGVCGLLGRFSIIGITCLRCSSNSGSERHFGTYFFTSCFSGSSCTDWIAKVCPSWQPVSQLCLLMGGANTLTKKVCAYKKKKKKW